MCVQRVHSPVIPLGNAYRYNCAPHLRKTEVTKGISVAGSDTEVALLVFNASMIVLLYQYVPRDGLCIILV